MIRSDQQKIIVKPAKWPLAVGMHPFWFWNDDIQASEIRWQIEQMAQQGVRGFFICARQGLQQPYLSESFFQLVDVAIQAAARHKMTVHLYDEYPYPSGAAGGEVILGNPQFRATTLVQQQFDLSGGTIRQELPRGTVLCCFVYLKASGLTSRNTDTKQWNSANNGGVHQRSPRLARLSKKKMGRLRKKQKTK